jgi:nicotinamidase-related amidase
VTGLVFVDPYNDFLSEGGKLWPLLKDVATEVGLHDNLRRIVAAAREAGAPYFVAPHHRAEPDDFAGWRQPTPYQLAAAGQQAFAKGSWGGEWHPDFAPRAGDVVAQEHWGASGFANTDLDRQLRQRGVDRIVVVGLIANTCIEGTARYAMELGYHVTLVKDATAAFTREAMRAAHEINGPAYAHAILTTREAIELWRGREAA